MTLKERINKDMVDAMKAADKDRLSVLRLALSQIHNREIEAHKPGKDAALSDEEVTSVLQKEIKKRREALELFEKGNRKDLAKREEYEITVIGEYVPKAIGKQEIEQVVAELIKEGHKDFPGLMREAMKRLKGRADGHMVGAIVKEKLGISA